MPTNLLEIRDVREARMFEASWAPEMSRRRRPSSGRRGGRRPAPEGAGGLTGPASHTPVLAGELIELLDPRPGQVADRLHVR